MTDLLREACARRPDQPAVWHGGVWWSYQQLYERAERLARFLAGVGVSAGDRVALLLENSPTYVVAFFGALRAGAVVVPLNTDTRTDGLVYILNDCGAKAVISNRKHARRLVPALARAPELTLAVFDQPEPPDYEVGGCLQTSLDSACDSAADGSVDAPRIDVDLASIVYTSGSTGRPKGVMLTHLNLVSNTRSVVEYLSLRETDRVLAILPFFYIYGQSLLLTHIFVGGAVAIENRFVYPNVALETMATLEATGFAGVPSTFSLLLQRSALASFRFPRLRYVTQAGGAMPPAMQKEVAKAFAPAELYVMYGATEAAPRLAYLHPRDLPRKWGSIGKAVPNVQLFIADSEGRPLPSGESGEIVARGSNIFQGYWNEREQTERVLRNGAYRTGDLGRMDDEGFFFVVGRASDIIKVKGFRVSPQEVEAALSEHADVAEVAVVGTPDVILGEAIVAFVVAKVGSDLTPGALLAFAKQRLPTYRQPSRILMVDSLPKNRSGKVMKAQLEVPSAASPSPKVEVTSRQTTDSHSPR